MNNNIKPDNSPVALAIRKALGLKGNKGLKQQHISGLDLDYRYHRTRPRSPKPWSLEVLCYKSRGTDAPPWYL